MIRLFTISILFLFLSINLPAQDHFGIVVHGGAGSIYQGRYSAEEEQEYINALDEAVNVGYEILENGGSSLDAVETVIILLENNPLFNSGKGAVLNSLGKAELDASIMDGKTGQAGAVANVSTIKNPISAARKVLEESPHVLLIREGAEKFAKLQGLDVVPNGYFITEKMLNSYKRIKKQKMEKEERGNLDFENDSKFGTVGVAALDKEGNLAAGTSTGGMMYKQFGRVGDSPIIGAGTYANNSTCAISSTGHGEYFIRGVIAYDISAVMEYADKTIHDAASYVINDKLEAAGGKGGIIGIDSKGNIVMEFNTQGMFRAWRSAKGGKEVMMYR